MALGGGLEEVELGGGLEEVALGGGLEDVALGGGLPASHRNWRLRTLFCVSPISNILV